MVLQCEFEYHFFCEDKIDDFHDGICSEKLEFSLNSVNDCRAVKKDLHSYLSFVGENIKHIEEQNNRKISEIEFLRDAVKLLSMVQRQLARGVLFVDAEEVYQSFEGDLSAINYNEICCGIVASFEPFFDVFCKFSDEENLLFGNDENSCSELLAALNSASKVLECIFDVRIVSKKFYSYNEDLCAKSASDIWSTHLELSELQLLKKVRSCVAV
jgi:hypothetical protein